MGLNRRQQAHIEELEKDAKFTRRSGRYEWEAGNEFAALGNDCDANIHRNRARDERAEYERIKDEIDNRRANPGNYDWNR